MALEDPKPSDPCRLTVKEPDNYQYEGKGLKEGDIGKEGIKEEGIADSFMDRVNMEIVKNRHLFPISKISHITKYFTCNKNFNSKH